MLNAGPAADGHDTSRTQRSTRQRAQGARRELGAAEDLTQYAIGARGRAAWLGLFQSGINARRCSMESLTRHPRHV
jgi:hypothetical protein